MGGRFTVTVATTVLCLSIFIYPRIRLEEKGLKVRLETVYPENGRVTLKVVEGERQPLALNLRYPVCGPAKELW